MLKRQVSEYNRLRPNVRIYIANFKVKVRVGLIDCLVTWQNSGVLRNKQLKYAYPSKSNGVGVVTVNGQIVYTFSFSADM